MSNLYMTLNLHYVITWVVWVGLLCDLRCVLDKITLLDQACVQLNKVYNCGSEVTVGTKKKEKNR